MHRTIFTSYVFMTVLFLSLSGYAETLQQGSKNTKKCIDIHFDDLKDRYRIIGRLGKPVGEYYTIHGTWKKFSFSSKSLFFHVTHVNQQPLTKPVIYPERDFLPYNPYVLNLEIEAVNSPVCEYRVFESLYFYGTPKAFWKESGIVPVLGINPLQNEQDNHTHSFELTSELCYHFQPQLMHDIDQVKSAETSIISECNTKSFSTNCDSNQSYTTQKPGLINIDFYDLRDDYRIIGKLGKPVGEYSTIRGVWKKEKGNKNRGNWIRRFYVTHVDGCSLKKSISYEHGWEFLNIRTHPFEPPIPLPEDFDIWEIRVVETVRHSGVSKNYIKEVEPFNYPGAFKLKSYLRYHHRPKITRDVKSK